MIGTLGGIAPMRYFCISFERGENFAIATVLPSATLSANIYSAFSIVLILDFRILSPTLISKSLKDISL